MSLLLLVAYFVTGALLIMLLIAATNTRSFPRLQVAERRENGEFGRISILVPARDEAPVLMTVPQTARPRSPRQPRRATAGCKC
jgi:hypothetical protein